MNLESIERPSPNRPMLVGLLVDVSGSMTSEIENDQGATKNRLEAFREALGDLAERGNSLCKKGPDDEPVELVKLFAYGFGFGNPLGVLLGRVGDAVRDLLRMPGRDSSLVSIHHLSERWEEYKSHVTDLAIEMLGRTPMVESLRMTIGRFESESDQAQYCRPRILFLLSDGMPTDGRPDEVLELATSLRRAGVLIVSCYVTDRNLTRPRHLYDIAKSSWPDGARLMIDCASTLPSDPAFAEYLKDHGWSFGPNGRLFTQINQSEVLSEFLNLILSPLENSSSVTAMSSTTPVSVFYSYAHEDEKMRDQLEKHLSILKRQGHIVNWYDRCIGAGRDWSGQIDDNFRSSEVVLLLISEDFLNSDYCYDIELGIAMQRHDSNEARVIPVILKPVDWRGAPFGKLSALPTDARPVSKWGSRAEAFTNIAKGIRSAVEEIQAGR